MRYFLSTLLVALLPIPALAGLSNQITIVPQLVGEHELSAEFLVGADCGNFVKGVGFFECFEGRILMTFEEPASLAAESLIITAEVIDPDGNDILPRLPNGVFIPEEFPVLIRILDDENNTFTFSNTWRLEIQTRELSFEAHSTLRLFRAEEGCAAPGCVFEDFTRSTGIGSFRASGSFGTFSDFIIATDLRPRGVIVTSKITQINDTIDFYKDSDDIDSDVALELKAKLAEVSAALAVKDFYLAVDKVYEFMDLMFFYDDGFSISDGWDPDSSGVSVIGILYGLSESLVYAIEELERPQPVSRGGTQVDLVTETDLGLQVTVNFEDATSFQPESLDFIAYDIDPLDPTILERLPNGVAIDPNFPVSFAIGADPYSRPAARGDWQVQMRTRGLDFLVDSPYRLFKADFGGNFSDVTTSLGVGSLLAGAHVGRFDEFGLSEYVIAKDLRDVDTVIGDKVGDLETMIDLFNLDATVKANLVALLLTAKTSYQGGDPAQAIIDLDAFLAYIDERAGVDLLDIWRSDDNRLNHAGLLSARAKTLQFSLALAKAPVEGDPADVNNDGKVDAADAFLVLEKVYCPNGCNQAIQLPGLSPASEIPQPRP